MRKLKRICMAGGTAFLMFSMCGCASNINNSTSIDDELVSVDNASEAVATGLTGDETYNNYYSGTETTSKRKSTIEATDTTDNATTDTDTTDETETTELNETNEIPNAHDDGSIYNYSESDSELLQIAAKEYDTAVAKYKSFIFDCPYSLNSNNMLDSDSGESYVEVTGVSSLESVISDYENYFSEKYENPIPSHYVEQNGVVYFLVEDRGDDASYQSTAINKITSKTENEVFFSVTSSYSDGTQRQDEFSILCSNGNWKIGEFTYPN